MPVTKKTRGDNVASELAGLESAGVRSLLEAMDAGFKRPYPICDHAGFDRRSVYTYLGRLTARGLIRRGGGYYRKEYSLTEHGKRYLWAMRVLCGDALPGKIVRPYEPKKKVVALENW